MESAIAKIKTVAKIEVPEIAEAWIKPPAVKPAKTRVESSKPVKITSAKVETPEIIKTSATVKSVKSIKTVEKHLNYLH